MSKAKFNVGDVICPKLNINRHYIVTAVDYKDGDTWAMYHCKDKNNTSIKEPFMEYEIEKVEGQDEPMPKIEANDVVNHPNHYMKNGVECIDMIKAIVADMKGNTAYCVGNVVKYLWRFQNKNGLTDLYKAKKYIEMLIEELEKNDENKI